MPTAFSYLRFSSPEQAKGDSIRRQTEATAEWCKRHGATLDESLNLRDEGVSAFRGKHRSDPDLYALAGFMQAVKTGRVRNGSYLVVESLDRLSREKIRPALTLLLNLIEAGVKVVQLIPVETVYDEDVEPMALLQAIMELNRGHSESKVKSERVGAASARKRKDAATKLVTKRVPSWIDCKDGKLVLNREKAKTVRRLFRLAADGFGLTGIARKMNEDGVPLPGRQTFEGRTVVWSAALVWKILTSRACIGEYQPHRGRPNDREPSGPPVRDYYPPVVDRAEFAAVQAALRSRSLVGRGRRGKHVNLFSGLLKDARTGGSIMVRFNTKRGSILFPSAATHGRGDPWVVYPFETFEAAILSKLIEVTVEDIQPDRETSNKRESLAARLAEVETLVKKWQAKMDRPELVEVVADKLTDLERERREVGEKLADAQREADTPLAEVVRELHVVGKALNKDSGDDNRTRCRSAIRRAVESIWCLFMPGRGTRLAAVQVWFKGNAHRDYIISSEPGHANATSSRLARWSVRSMPVAKSGKEFDLRNPAHVKDLEAALLKASPANFKSETKGK